MFDNKFALTALAALSVLSYAPPLAAMTLVADSERDFKLEQGYNGWYYGYDGGSGFQQNLQPAWGEFKSTGGSFNGQSSQAMVRRWTSDFDGNVKLGINFSGTANSADGTEFFQKVRLNGQTILSESSAIRLSDSSYNLGIFEVKKGDNLDFLFNTTDDNWLGGFKWGIEIEAEKKDSFILSQLSPLISFDDKNDNIVNNQSVTAVMQQEPSEQFGLIFIMSKEGKPIDVGLLKNGMVYNADPILGVRQVFLGKFIQDKSYNIQFLDSNVANKMSQKIATKLGSKYLDSSSNTIPNPFEQKGYSGRFTNIGLIEWAAEESSVFGGQGFIDTFLESAEGFAPGLTVTTLYDRKSIVDALFKIVRDSIKSDYESIKYSDIYKLYSNLPPSQGSDNWFRGELEAVDFIITDPLGRKMGYVSNFGFFNEIPEAIYSFENFNLINNMNWILYRDFAVDLSTIDLIPKMTYTTSRQIASETLNSSTYCSQFVPENTSPRVNGVFRLLIERRLPGEYKIEKREPKDCLIRRQMRQTIPEPGAIAGLIATAGFALKFLKRRTQ